MGEAPPITLAARMAVLGYKANIERERERGKNQQYLAARMAVLGYRADRERERERERGKNQQYLAARMALVSSMAVWASTIINSFCSSSVEQTEVECTVSGPGVAIRGSSL